MLIHNWRQVLKRAWSVRLIVLAGALTGIEAMLPFVALPIPAGLFCWSDACGDSRRVRGSHPRSKGGQLMPINKITATKRGKAAIAAVLLAASVAGWTSISAPSPSNPPPAVILATDTLIKPWEGLVLESHWDRFAKIWDICYGETKGITAGMRKTKAECEDMLNRRVFNDYYLPLTRQIRGSPLCRLVCRRRWCRGLITLVYPAWLGVGRQAFTAKASVAKAAKHRPRGTRLAVRLTAASSSAARWETHSVAGEAKVCVSGLPGGAK